MIKYEDLPEDFETFGNPVTLWMYCSNCQRYDNAKVSWIRYQDSEINHLCCGDNYFIFHDEIGGVRRGQIDTR